MQQPNFFTENSPFLKHPLLTPERTAAEIDFVLKYAQNGPFLDVGCGFGRHTLELAQRGYTVVGIDPAEAMIAAANTRKDLLAIEVQERATFVVASGENFDTDHHFEAAICLMTTFGQVSANGPNNDLLSAIAKNLKPSGTLILEVPQKRAIENTLKPEDRFGNETHYTAITRKFDAETNCVVETFEIVSPEGRSHFLLSYRIFEQLEVEKNLNEARFRIRNSFGDFKGSKLTTDSLNMIIVAEAND